MELAGCEHSGNSHWWVPPLLALGACLFAAAALPTERREEEEKPPQEFEVRGCRQEEANGVYQFDGYKQDKWGRGRRWRKKHEVVLWQLWRKRHEVVLFQYANTWMIKSYHDTIAEAGRLARGRFRHELPGLWMDGGPRDAKSYLNPSMTVEAVATGPAEAGGGGPSAPLLSPEGGSPAAKAPTKARASCERVNKACVWGALACWAPVVAVFVQTMQGGLDHEACTLPPVGLPPLPFAECGCAVLFQRIVLPTIAIGTTTVLLSFLANAATTVAKVLWARGCGVSGDELGEAVWVSLGAPSRPLLCVSAAVQLVHLARLFVVTSSPEGAYHYYLEFNANLINSGATAFYTDALLGMVLTSSLADNELLGYTAEEPYLHPTTPAGLRFVMAIIMLLVCLPAQVKIWKGMLKWPYLSIPTEMTLALAMQAFFPEASDCVSGTIECCRTIEFCSRASLIGPVLSTFYLFVFRLSLPLHEPVAYFLQKASVFQRQSPVGPLVRTLVAALLCFLKSMAVQFF